MGEDFELSVMMQSVTKRFGGLKETQPFKPEDCEEFYLHQTVQGPILLNHHVQMSSKSSMECVEILHGASFEYAINSVMASVTKPNTQKTHSKFKVDLNPDSDRKANFEIEELKRLISDLEMMGFTTTHFTQKKERSVSASNVKVDMMLFLDFLDGRTAFVSSVVIAPVEDAVLLGTINIIQQLTPLLKWQIIER